MGKILRTTASIKVLVNWDSNLVVPKKSLYCSLLMTSHQYLIDIQSHSVLFKYIQYVAPPSTKKQIKAIISSRLSLTCSCIHLCISSRPRGSSHSVRLASRCWFPGSSAKSKVTDLALAQFGDLVNNVNRYHGITL